MSDVIDIFTTGGTIDKVYFDALSEFQIGPTAIPDLLRENNVHVPHRVTQLMRKDSLELGDADRAAIRAAVELIQTCEDMDRQLADNARNAARQHATDWTPAPQPQRPDDVWERIREGFFGEAAFYKIR